MSNDRTESGACCPIASRCERVGYCIGEEVADLMGDSAETGSIRDEAAELLASIADALNDVYAPAGVLMFWSARVTYLDGATPADVWARRDLVGLRRLDQRLNALADGAFV